ncbi:unnamed protein product [Heligmosomoides polygyrus]|uniref:Col_cuticle_N domain-containing protein n=1 Tax=Heligmosomoides polygyrus TaxID=6339 RepID=A0A3P7YJP4_HELPZ|nr:unnamed protein product [Heligmosomoides polygyrus]
MWYRSVLSKPAILPQEYYVLREFKINDPDVRLSIFNVISACVIALLLTALAVILIVAYIRAKSKSGMKKMVSTSITVESSLDSISISNNNYSNNNIRRFTDSFLACSSSNRNVYDSIVAV